MALCAVQSLIWPSRIAFTPSSSILHDSFVIDTPPTELANVHGPLLSIAFYRDVTCT